MRQCAATKAEKSATSIPARILALPSAPRPRDRAAAGRGGRTGAAAPGQQTSEGGGGGAAQGLGFFRTVGGEDMSAKLAFIAAHLAEHAVRLMCRVLGVVPAAGFMTGSGRLPQ